MVAKLKEIKQQLRQRMHDPVKQTGQWLRSVVQGYFNYHAVPGNISRMSLFPISGDATLAMGTPSQGPTAPAQLGTNRPSGRPLAPDPACAPPLPQCALRRKPSEIRAVCANERPYGSERGVPGNRYPYRDRAPG